MKNAILFLCSGLLMSLSAWAVQRDTEADALRHKKLENTPIYGELYQSLTFDGSWNSDCHGQAFRYKGKFDRNYSAWIDCFGDVIVGFYDNVTEERSMKVVLDHKNYKTDKSLVSLSYTNDGKLFLYVAKKGDRKVLVFTSKAENINSWKLSSVNAGIKIQNMTTCNAGSASYLALNGARKLILLKSNKGSMKKCLTKNVENDIKLFKLHSLGEAPYLAINNIIYACNNQLEEVAKFGGEAMEDFVPVENGFVAVNKSQKGLQVSKLIDKKLKTTTIKTNNLAGDVVIDPDDAANVYFTRNVNGISEIFRATNKKGSRWNVEAVTENSPFNNRDIVAVANTPAETPVQFLWLQESLKDVKVNTLSSVKMNIFQPQITDITSIDQIKTLMTKVADWQLGRSYIDKAKNDWQWGAFYTGLIAAHKRLQSPFYWNEMMNLSQYYDWSLLPDQLHADRLLCCEIYMYLYEQSGMKNKRMMHPTRLAMDLHTSRKAHIDVRFYKNDYKFEWWSWADALYMAPASFFNYSRITKDDAAMKFANQQWLAVEDYLYSKTDSLFYRDDRYFDKKSTNGHKVFWARGNGWVMGALPRIINALPKHHEFRAHYVELYKAMAAKIKNLQMPEGLWTCSLYDPEELNIGESSGSGFFGYALAWGINQGILDKDEYMDTVMKAWKGMTDNVTSFGKLGYVQQIAGDPYPFFYHQYHTYASGAFLLFANEMIDLFNINNKELWQDLHLKCF